jgi:hypothetical protein
MRTEAKASPRRQAALRTIGCGRDIAALVNALMPVVLEGFKAKNQGRPAPSAEDLNAAIDRLPEGPTTALASHRRASQPSRPRRPEWSQSGRKKEWASDQSPIAAGALGGRMRSR